MKYLIIACSLGVLSACQSHTATMAQIVKQGISGKVNELKEHYHSEQDPFTYRDCLFALEKRNYEKAASKIEKIVVPALKSQACDQFDRSCFSHMKEHLKAGEFEAAFEKVDLLYSATSKQIAFYEIGNHLSATTERLEKHRLFFDRALEGYQKQISAQKGDDAEISGNFEYARLLYKVDPKKAKELLDVICEHNLHLATQNLEKSEARGLLSKQGLVCLEKVIQGFQQQAQDFNDLDLAKKTATKAKPIIYRIENPETRAQYLIYFLDHTLSLFQDVEGSKQLIPAIEKTLEFIESDDVRENRLKDFKKVKSKHNLLLCNYEE